MPTPTTHPRTPSRPTRRRRGIPARQTDPAERERGSVSVWTAMITAVIFLLVGVAVDLGGRIASVEHARDIAAQAARAGSQQLAGAAVLGGPNRLDPTTAAAAARDYLAAAGAAGSVTVEADTVRVTVTETYRTRFLGVVGIGSMTVHGTGTARIVRAVDGTPQ